MYERFHDSVVVNFAKTLRRVSNAWDKSSRYPFREEGGGGTRGWSVRLCGFVYADHAFEIQRGGEKRKSSTIFPRLHREFLLRKRGELPFFTFEPFLNEQVRKRSYKYLFNVYLLVCEITIRAIFLQEFNYITGWEKSRQMKSNCAVQPRQEAVIAKKWYKMIVSMYLDNIAIRTIMEIVKVY